MSHLLELKDGRIVRVESFEEISKDTLNELIAEARQRLTSLEAFTPAEQEDAPAPVEEAQTEPVNSPEPPVETPAAEEPTPTPEATAEVVPPAEPVQLTTTTQETPATPAPVVLN